MSLQRSFHDDLKDFRTQGMLKHVETKVKTPDGRELLESRDSDGVVSVKETGRGLGFVPDLKPDLQIADVCNGLCFGSQDVAHNFDLLNNESITHILNLAPGVPNSFPDSFTYKNIDILDTPDFNIRPIFDECFNFIDAGKSDGGRVFVHCNAGISRSATVVLAYLMKVQTLNLVDALHALKITRPSIKPNCGFHKALMDYNSELIRGLSPGY